MCPGENVGTEFLQRRCGMRDTMQQSLTTRDAESSYWRAVPRLVAVGDQPFQNIEEAVDCLCRELVQVTGEHARFVPSSQRERENNARIRASHALAIPVCVNQRLYGELIVFSRDDSSVPALSPEVAFALAAICAQVLTTIEIRLIMQEQYKRFDLTTCKPLTPREEEVLSLMAKGQNIQEIAQSLCLSPQTVRTHRRNIFKKLNVHTERDALTIARYQQERVPSDLSC